MNSFFLILVLAASSQSPDRSREEMVRTQIEARGIADRATLHALRAVPRHLFVPENLRDEAYDDGPLPIGCGQTISQPYIVACMTELLEPRKGQRILEIGTGSGYQAAVLSTIVDSVFTMEIITELADSADHRLRQLGYANIVVRNGDGYFGWKSKGPFDGIIVTAAAEHIPLPLIEQLKEGAKMVIPVGTPWLVQTLMLVEKEHGEIRTHSLFPVRFVPLTRGD